MDTLARLVFAWNWSCMRYTVIKSWISVYPDKITKFNNNFWLNINA